MPELTQFPKFPAKHATLSTTALPFLLTWLTPASGAPSLLQIFLPHLRSFPEGIQPLTRSLQPGPAMPAAPVPPTETSRLSRASPQRALQQRCRWVPSHGARWDPPHGHPETPGSWQLPASRAGAETPSQRLPLSRLRQRTPRPDWGAPHPPAPAPGVPRSHSARPPTRPAWRGSGLPRARGSPRPAPAHPAPGARRRWGHGRPPGRRAARPGPAPARPGARWRVAAPAPGPALGRRAPWRDRDRFPPRGVTSPALKPLQTQPRAPVPALTAAAALWEPPQTPGTPHSTATASRQGAANRAAVAKFQPCRKGGCGRGRTRAWIN